MLDDEPSNESSSLDPNRFFLAKLVIHKPEGKKVVCSGTLINSKFILTAAHCLCDIFIDCDKSSGLKVVTDNDLCEY